MTDFYDQLRIARERAGLSQVKLGMLAGYNHSYVSRLEGGSRMPTRDAVVNLAAAMGCDELQTDTLLMAADYLPNNPQNMLRQEPIVWEAFTLLTSGGLPSDVGNDMRSALKLAIRQARRAGIAWVEAGS